MQDDYELLDSGEGRKLERLGELVLDRPVAHALWRRALPAREWELAHGVYHRSEKGGGSWSWRGAEPSPWEVSVGGLRLLMKATPFGHLGLFAEQLDNWAWLRETVSALHGEPEVLNLFAYTGGSTLAAAAAGARVCHLDSSKGAVDWARENARLSRLEERPVRWIVEDVTRFTRRERKRGRRYRGVVLDPPTFGRGRKGEVFKIEEDLPELLATCTELCHGEPDFVLLSCHSASFSPLVLGQLLEERVPAGGELQVGEMAIPQPDGRVLPSGTYARWRAS